MIDQHLSEHETMVGNAVTLADIALYSAVLYPFQLVIDGGGRRAVPKVTEWFGRMSDLPFIQKELGKVKLCTKSIL